MRLLSLHLEQFRNYGNRTLDFPADDLHLFLGPNGSGKTNILEAVALLSLTKSFLPVEDEDLRQWGTDFYRVRARARADSGEEEELEVVSQVMPRKTKACFWNGVRTPASLLIGKLPVVTFLPQDLSLFSGSPAERRRFVDQILSQVSGQYLSASLQYQRVLKQRNALLKAIADGSAEPDHLDPWDRELAEHGSVLIAMRFELMETFNLTLHREVLALGESWSDTTMQYQTGCQSRTVETLRGELLQRLKDVRERDAIIQSTTVGPHRDDWTVLADGRPLQTFASRGQQRTMILALLFLEGSYLEVRRGEKPVVLLDDIFSELDTEHRERVLTAFSGHQVLLTATGMPTGEDTFPGAVSRVEGGKILSAKIS